MAEAKFYLINWRIGFKGEIPFKPSHQAPAGRL